MKKSDGFRMKALYAVSSILLGLIQRAVGIGNNLLQGDGSAIHMGNADTDGDMNHAFGGMHLCLINSDSQFVAMPQSITPAGIELNPTTEPIDEPIKDEIK